MISIFGHRQANSEQGRERLPTRTARVNADKSRWIIGFGLPPPE